MVFSRRPRPGAEARSWVKPLLRQIRHDKVADVITGFAAKITGTRQSAAMPSRLSVMFFELELQLDGARVARNNADAESSEITLSVVNSVKGDPNFGENSAFYSALGYVPKDDRRSGLTRVSNAETPAQPVTVKVAA